MAKEKTTKKKMESKTSEACNDRLCPVHGNEKVKLRGRVFEGTVIRKFHDRAVIEFERVLYDSKYERYEKRKTKLHAKLFKCMENQVEVGDLIKIEECRPLSKIIHFIVTGVVTKMNGDKQ
jgi:small subunit ribosomal protein S17